MAFGQTEGAPKCSVFLRGAAEGDLGEHRTGLKLQGTLEMHSEMKGESKLPGSRPSEARKAGHVIKGLRAWGRDLTPTQTLRNRLGWDLSTMKISYICEMDSI